MEHSEQINELATALAKAQGAMSNVIAGQTATIATRTGGQYSYSYADLASILQVIRKPLSDNGLCILQGIHAGEGSVVIATELIHASGQWVRSELAMLLPEGATPQNIGSVITYGRRYGLTALVGIAQEDDDAKSASEKPQQAPRPPAPKPTREVPDSVGTRSEEVRKVETQTIDPTIERHQRMSKAAMKRWPLQPGDTVAALIGPWLKNKDFGIWANMSPEKQEEAITKMLEEAKPA